MVAEDFLQDPQVRQWLDGIEPAWTLLTFESLRALRQEPSAVQTAIRIANDLGADEIAGSPVARNTLILLRQAIERSGLYHIRFWRGETGAAWIFHGSDGSAGAPWLSTRLCRCGLAFTPFVSG